MRLKNKGYRERLQLLSSSESTHLPLIILIFVSSLHSEMNKMGMISPKIDHLRKTKKNHLPRGPVLSPVSLPD